MGRSDKPAATSDYTLDAHVDWVCQLLEQLDLNRITLFCQDWGGIIGLVVAMELPDRFDRIIASNTGIPVGEGENQFMRDWIAFSQSVDVLPVGALLQSGSTRDLSAAEVAAYDAPFPDGSFQAAAKQFPLLIPVQPDNPGVPRCRVTWERLANWDKPFLTIFGTEDAVAYKPGSHRRFQREVPGAQGQPHLEIEGANHFIQEDASEELVAAIDAFVKATAS
jgi:haloalkane dehalogenase